MPTDNKISKAYNSISIDEIERPTIRSVCKVVYSAARGMCSSRPAQIVGLGFLLIMFWGYHGELELLRFVWPAWRGPGSDPATRPSIIAGLPWDHELISFGIGILLLVCVPILVIKLVWKERLSDYGLGLPPSGRLSFAVGSFFVLVALCLAPFYIGAKDESMRAVYPLFRGLSGARDFVLYELSYFPFFLAIEFVFRGYLLFGLAPYTDTPLKRGALAEFPIKALLIQMLPYTVWHLGKPIPELWGTPVWGIAAGALAYTGRSIWPVVFAHWILNVWLDAASFGFF